MTAQLITSRLLSVALALVSATCVQADSVKVHYLVRPIPEVTAEAGVRVEMHVGGLEGVKSIRLQMPRWTPGDYHIQDHGKHVQAESASSAPEHTNAWKRVDAHTWEVSTDGFPAVVFSYGLPNTPPGFFSENVKVTDRYAFYNGPSVYMYVVGHKEAASSVSFDLPEGWKHVVPLEAAKPVNGKPSYSAPDYDTLADSPVALGDVVTREFTAVGRPHTIAFFNRHQGTEYDGFVEPIKKVVEEENRLMGGPPYSRYVFFLDVGGRGGGLEHLNSTRMGWNPRFGARGIAGLVAHEFFHLWNVKRFRPVVLGPFDYIEPPKTRNLWFAEGVTSYYGDLSVLRAGLSTEDRYLNSIGRSIASYLANPARRRLTPDDASYRVWEANNSDGFGGLSYYQAGELIGLCLDLKIRGVTGNRSSLDHVMRDLMARHGLPKPGFPEDGIRDAVIRAGGPEMGPFYDRVARSTEEMPFEECLGFAGLTLQRSPNGVLSIVPNPSAAPEQIALRRSWLTPVEPR